MSLHYPDWELARQREALRALLGGGGQDGGALRKARAKREAPGSGAAGRSPSEGTGRFGGGGTPGGAPPEEGASVPRETRLDGAERSAGVWGVSKPRGGKRFPEGEAFPRGGGEGLPDTLQVRRSPAREGTGPRRKGFPGGTAAAGEAWAAMDGEPGGGTAAGRDYSPVSQAERETVPEPGGRSGGWGPWGGGEAAFRAEDGARALSQAVQRDARRYDGGFSIR